MPKQRVDEELNISCVGLIQKVFGYEIQYFMEVIKAKFHLRQKFDPGHNREM
jgi:hypothetical protein